MSVLLTVFAISTWTTATIRHGMGLSTGIDLEALVDVGEYICNILKKPTQSKVARAIVSKRANDEA
jgi:hydroxymethylglutaryl-CoA lyase